MKSQPFSVRFDIEELNYYKTLADARGVPVSTLITEAMAEKYKPDEHRNDLWYGHS
jgi:hypothetical protein